MSDMPYVHPSLSQMADEVTEVLLSHLKTISDFLEPLVSSAVLVADGEDFVATAAYQQGCAHAAWAKDSNSPLSSLAVMAGTLPRLAGPWLLVGFAVCCAWDGGVS